MVCATLEPFPLFHQNIEILPSQTLKIYEKEEYQEIYREEEYQEIYKKEEYFIRILRSSRPPKNVKKGNIRKYTERRNIKSYFKHISKYPKIYEIEE